MIELNLLPDVKLEYIKAQRQRYLIATIAFLVTAIAIAILLILFVFDLAQKKDLSGLNKDISSETAQLRAKPDIGKILTVQNQLESLTALHAQKPAASRLFTSYLDQITPGAVSISDLDISFTQDTVTITGTTDSLATVDTYVDTLKFTTYTSNEQPKATDAFSNVVLSSFGLNSDTTDPTQAASYSISLAYAKPIFDITQNVTLTVPNLITTRSELEQPGNLFKTQPASTTTSHTSTNTGGQ
jgi:Tfp pilus assembly protein PilN